MQCSAEQAGSYSSSVISTQRRDFILNTSTYCYIARSNSTFFCFHHLIIILTSYYSSLCMLVYCSFILLYYVCTVFAANFLTHGNAKPDNVNTGVFTPGKNPRRASGLGFRNSSTWLEYAEGRWIHFSPSSTCIATAHRANCSLRCLELFLPFGRSSRSCSEAKPAPLSIKCQSPLSYRINGTQRRGMMLVKRIEIFWSVRQTG